MIGWNSQQTNVKKLRQVAVLIMVDDDKQVGFRKCPLSCDPLRRGRTVRHAALGSLSLCQNDDGKYYMALCTQIHHHRCCSIQCSSHMKLMQHRRCGSWQIVTARPIDGSSLSHEPRSNGVYISTYAYCTTLTRCLVLSTHDQLGVEFGSKLIEIPEQGKVIKLQCSSPTFRSCSYLLPATKQPLTCSAP